MAVVLVTESGTKRLIAGLSMRGFMMVGGGEGEVVGFRKLVLVVVVVVLTRLGKVGEGVLLVYLLGSRLVELSDSVNFCSTTDFLCVRGLG